MGGSGGGGYFFNDKSPKDIAKQIRDEENNTKNVAFNTQVTYLLSDLLADVNSRDTQTVQTHLNTIENALHSKIDGFIDLKYAGSVSKHTYVDGLSDIDSIALINNSELSNLNPSEVKKYFFKMLKNRLPNTDVLVGNLCVTINFSSGTQIQILPAIQTKTGIKIPSSRRDNEWSHVVKPQKFALALRYSNIKMSGKLIPVIKLAKAIIGAFPESRKLSGYHVEALAIETFHNYTGKKTSKEMLKHFFNQSTKNVLSPIKDKSGQSIHVDDHLGTANSINRKMVSDSLSTVARKMQNADGSNDIKIWEQILK